MRTSLAPCVLLARLLHPADSASVVASDVGGLVAAVANSSIDHITLAPGHYLLSSQLNVERTLSIVVQVTTTAVLDGQDLNRVLRIKEATVELTGLNITRGYSHSEQTGLSGGCVSITSGSVSIERSHIYACRAYAVGGGIFVDFRGAPPTASSSPTRRSPGTSRPPTGEASTSVLAQQFSAAACSITT